MREDESLSNDELLAEFVGKAAATRLQQHFGGLTRIARASMRELGRVGRLDLAQASLLKRAFLLARRLSEEKYPEGTVLDTPSKMALLVREFMRVQTKERLLVILLDAELRLLGVRTLAEGTSSRVLVDPGKVFAEAISVDARGIALVHNHPQRRPDPSEQDLEFSRIMIQAGEIMDIEVIDHIILGEPYSARSQNYISLWESGRVQFARGPMNFVPRKRVKVTLPPCEREIQVFHR